MLTIDEIIVCPLCHNPLPLKAIRRFGAGDCPKCHCTYTSSRGIFRLIPEPIPDQEIFQKWALWTTLQEHGMLSYKLRPEQNLSIGPREDAKAFGHFCQLSGLILDIGCGPQILPSYAADNAEDLVGIDPLIGQLPKHFHFAQAIGEYLPFRACVFDHVLLATTLDHMLSPHRVLQEAQRVLKPEGKIGIWVDLPEPSVTQKLLTKVLKRDFASLWRTIGRRLGLTPSSPINTDDQYLATLDVPYGAVDAYHLTKLNQRALHQWLDGAGLKVKRSSVFNGEVHLFIEAGFDV